MGGIPPEEPRSYHGKIGPLKIVPYIYIYIVPWPRFDLQIFYMDLVGRGSV